MRMTQTNLMAEVPEIPLDDDDDTSSSVNMRIHYWLETGRAPCTFGVHLIRHDDSSTTSKNTMKKSFFINKEKESISEEVSSPLKRKTSPKDESTQKLDTKKLKKIDDTADNSKINKNNQMLVIGLSQETNHVYHSSNAKELPKKIKNENGATSKINPVKSKQKTKSPQTPKKIDPPIVHKRITSPVRRKRRPFSPPQNLSPTKFFLAELQGERITRSKMPLLRSSMKQVTSLPSSPEKTSLRPKKLSFLTPDKTLCAYADMNYDRNDTNPKQLKTGTKLNKKHIKEPPKKQNKIIDIKKHNNCGHDDSSDISGLTANYILTTRLEKSKTDSKLKAQDILSRSKVVKPLITNNVKTPTKKIGKNKINDKNSSSSEEIFPLNRIRKSPATQVKNNKKPSHKEIKLIKTPVANRKPIIDKIKIAARKTSSLYSDSSDDRKLYKKFFI